MVVPRPPADPDATATVAVAVDPVATAAVGTLLMTPASARIGAAAGVGHSDPHRRSGMMTIAGSAKVADAGHAAPTDGKASSTAAAMTLLRRRAEAFIGLATHTFGSGGDGCAGRSCGLLRRQQHRPNLG
jgi:hypothetical protein